MGSAHMRCAPGLSTLPGHIWPQAQARGYKSWGIDDCCLAANRVSLGSTWRAVTWGARTGHCRYTMCCINDPWRVYYLFLFIFYNCHHHPQGSWGGHSLCCVKKQNISKVKLLTKIHSTSGSQEKSFLGFLLFGIAQATFWVWKEAIWQDFPQRFVLNFPWFWLSLILSFISCYYLYLFKIVYCVFSIMLHILMENVGHTRKKTLSFHL